MTLVGHDVAELADVEDSPAIGRDLRIRGQLKIKDVLNRQSLSGASARTFAEASKVEQAISQMALIAARMTQAPSQ